MTGDDFKGNLLFKVCMHVCMCVCVSCKRVCLSACGVMGQGTRKVNSVLPDCKVTGVGRQINTINFD